MKFKKVCFSTKLSDLYGRDGYQSHIKVDKEYWYCFPKEPGFPEGWYKIRVTYIRSGCMFYVFPDYPEREEQFCPISCFMTSVLVLAEIDPIRDLGDKLEDIEVSKKLYRFDSEHTIVHNWPNEEIVEIDDEDRKMCITFSVLTEKIEE